VLDKVRCVLSRTRYDNGVVALPLGQIFDFDDEWGAGWGWTEQELVLVIQEACRAQLATATRPATG
jgi:hypothetical protein